MRTITIAVLVVASALQASGADAPIPGKTLLLKDHVAKPEKRLLKVVAKGPDISLGAGNDSIDDPVLVGGTLRVISGAAGGFDDTYQLPLGAWTYVGKAGAGKGYKLKGASPVRRVLVKAGKKLKIVAKGSALGHDLTTSPAPVQVILSLGTHRLCMRFDAAASFKPGAKFLAKNALAPATCGGRASTTTTSTTTPDGSSTTTSTSVPGSTTSTTPGSSTTSTTAVSTTTSTTIYSSFTEAPPEVLARLDEVLAATTGILNGGGTFDDVVDFLAGEPDVTNVFVDGVTLYMTVAGLQSDLHDGYAARLRDLEPASLTIAPGTAAAIGPIPGGTALGNPPTGQRMVGADRDGDGRRDVEKKALVISPYQFQFKANDSGQPVVAALNATPDYAGRVTFHEVTALPSTLLPMSVWTSWNDYDVIHVSTHGEKNRISLGATSSTCTALVAQIRSEIPDMTDRTGLSCGGTNATAPDGTILWSKASVRATAAFFFFNYPNGVPKRLVFLDACRTTFASGLADAIVGEDGIYLGWDEYVDSKHSRATAVRFYQDALGKGFPAWRSFVRQCAGGACVEPTSAGLASGQTKFAELEMAYDRGDLRLRENLTVVPPIVTGLCLEPTPEAPLEVSCPSCTGAFGVAVLYDVIVDGVVSEDLVLRQDPLDFALEQLRLFADADDVESGYANPIFESPFVTNLADGKWLVSPIQLYVNDVCPGDVVSYLPKLLLPAFDRAAGGIDNRDFSYPLDGPHDLTFDTLPF